MPLIIISGPPSSGKTKATKLLELSLAEKGKETVVVTEASLLSGEKNEVYADSILEKEVRGRLKSEVIRLLNKDKTVICDGLNYIKGFRYELYCASKAGKTTQVTVHCDVSLPDVVQFNLSRPDHEQYSTPVLNALYQRFEPPISTNRWDSPLFLALKDTELDTESIYKCLYERAPPPPNQSTQTQPLSNTDFIYQLLARMDVGMGGRAAEELIFGKEKITGGASSDLQSATNIAENMVKSLGMSEKIGLRVVQKDELAPGSTELMDLEITKMMNESYKRATQILKTHRKELDMLAEALIHYETLDSDDVKTILENKRPPPARPSASTVLGYNTPRLPFSDTPRTGALPPVSPPGPLKPEGADII